MPFNHIYFPPYFPFRRNYLPVSNYNTNNHEIKNEIQSTQNRQEERKEKNPPLRKPFSFLNLESDDLLILAVLFFLYMEKCDSILLYCVLLLLLFDIEIDNIFNLIS